MLRRVSLAAIGGVFSFVMVTQIANAEVLNEDACWQSDLSYRVWTYREVRDMARSGGSVYTPGNLTSDLLKVAPSIHSESENTQKFHRVPCPLPAATTAGGFYVQGGIGGGWSVPSSPGIQNGSGSGMTVDGSVGWRMRSSDGTGWGFVGAGATYFGHDEGFPAPFDDLKVKPGVVLYQSAGIGPNFPGFAPGQNFAPYMELGVGEANIKVSAAIGSATRWSAAPLLGAGMDYRIDSNWLIHAGVRTFFFGDRTYQLGAGGTMYTVSDRVTSATFGFIYQFGGQAMPPESRYISDIRLKRDIELVDRLPNGLGLYRYRYLWSDQRYVGVMAQEVSLVRADAVEHGEDGYLRVNYARLGMRLQTWDEWKATH